MKSTGLGAVGCELRRGVAQDLAGALETPEGLRLERGRFTRERSLAMWDDGTCSTSPLLENTHTLSLSLSVCYIRS